MDLPGVQGGRAVNRRSIPHTRDCSSHWDGECSCAPKTREELQADVDYLAGSVKRWRESAEKWVRERDEARCLVDLGVALLLAADAQRSADTLSRKRTWLLAGREAGKGAGR